MLGDSLFIAGSELSRLRVSYRISRLKNEPISVSIDHLSIVLQEAPLSVRSIHEPLSNHPFSHTFTKDSPSDPQSPTPTRTPAPQSPAVSPSPSPNSSPQQTPVASREDIPSEFSAPQPTPSPGIRSRLFRSSSIFSKSQPSLSPRSQPPQAAPMLSESDVEDSYTGKK